MLNVLPVTTVYFETPFTPSSFLLQTPFAVVAALDRRRKIQKQPQFLIRPDSALFATNNPFSLLSKHAFPLFSLASH